MRPDTKTRARHGTSPALTGQRICSSWQRFAAITARSKYNAADRQGFEENGMFGDTPLPGWRTWAVLVLVIVIGVIGFLAYETLTYK
jgi:hypothetical protein